MLSIERKVIDVGKDANNLQILKDIVGDELFRVIAERFSGQKIYFSNYSGYCSKLSAFFIDVKRMYLTHQSKRNILLG